MHEIHRKTTIFVDPTFLKMKYFNCNESSNVESRFRQTQKVLSTGFRDFVTNFWREMNENYYFIDAVSFKSFFGLKYYQGACQKKEMIVNLIYSQKNRHVETFLGVRGHEGHS